MTESGPEKSSESSKSPQSDSKIKITIEAAGKSETIECDKFLLVRELDGNVDNRGNQDPYWWAYAIFAAFFDLHANTARGMMEQQAKQVKSSIVIAGQEPRAPGR